MNGTEDGAPPVIEDQRMKEQARKLKEKETHASNTFKAREAEVQALRDAKAAEKKVKADAKVAAIKKEKEIKLARVQEKADAEQARRQAKSEAAKKAAEDKKEMARLAKVGKLKEAEEKRAKQAEAAEAKKLKAAEAKESKAKAAEKREELAQAARAARAVRDEERRKRQDEDRQTNVSGWDKFTYGCTLYSRIAYRKVQVQVILYRIDALKKNMGEEVYDAFANSDMKDANASFEACKEGVDKFLSELGDVQLDLGELLTKGESEYAAIKKPTPPGKAEEGEENAEEQQMTSE